MNGRCYGSAAFWGLLDISQSSLPVYTLRMRTHVPSNRARASASHETFCHLV